MTRGGRGPGNEIAVTFENVCRVTYETSRLNHKNMFIIAVFSCFLSNYDDPRTKAFHQKTCLCKDNAAINRPKLEPASLKTEKAMRW